MAIFFNFATAPYAVSRISLAMLFFYNGLTAKSTTESAESTESVRAVREPPSLEFFLCDLCGLCGEKDL